MAYCTQAQVERYVGEDELIAIADHDDDGTADAAVVTQAIEHADGTIDSYLGVKFVVPLTPPIPKEVRRISIMLTVCELQRGRDSGAEDQLAICKEAMEELEKIAKGVVKVPGLQPLPSDAPGAPDVRYTGQDRIFGRDHSL